MPKKKYHVDLTPEERTTLEQLLQRGNRSARQLTRARILLHAAEGLRDAEMAMVLAVGSAPVERTRQRFVQEHLEALTERPRPGGQRKLSGKQEAPLSAVAGTPAPSGQAHWPRQLLAAPGVELGLAESSARETVRPVRKKTPSSPGCTNRGVCPR